MKLTTLLLPLLKSIITNDYIGIIIDILILMICFASSSLETRWNKSSFLKNLFVLKYIQSFKIRTYNPLDVIRFPLGFLFKYNVNFYIFANK